MTTDSEHSSQPAITSKETKNYTINQMSSNCSTTSSLLISSSCSSSPRTHQMKSPVLLSFQPPPAKTTNTRVQSSSSSYSSSSSSNNNPPISYSSLESETVDEPGLFNQQEPLSVNSETNFDDQIVLRNFSSKIQPIVDDDAQLIQHQKDSFRAHLDTCNDSLAKLVHIINEQMPHDSSLISASVDRFSEQEPATAEVRTGGKYFVYNSEPPQEFRDSSSASPNNHSELMSCTNQSLITNLNIISINKNECTDEARLPNCMMPKADFFYTIESSNQNNFWNLTNQCYWMWLLVLFFFLFDFVLF